MAKHSMDSYKASMVKKIGHSEEVKFNVLFGDYQLENLNLSGASADCIVEKDQFKKQIQSALDYHEDDFTVSLKSGKTWQFHLGVIEEISSLEFIKQHISVSIDENGKETTIVKHSKSFEDQCKALNSLDFWNKYFKKGELLCYNDKNGNYTFFEMNKAIEAIINGFEWRLLETGRIKGDCRIGGALKKGVITCEYRNEDHKKCLVLGASGGTNDNANGYRLFNFFKEQIKYVEIRPLN